MKKIDAELLLQLPDIYDAETVRSRFAATVKHLHPDAKGCAGVPIAKVQQARDLLLNALKTQNSSCKTCHGAGKVRSGVMGWRECSACKGKGETR